MTAIRTIQFRTVRRPMKTVFATSLGRKSAATSVLATVVLADGIAATGEVPTSFVMPHETLEAIAAILREAREFFDGVPIDEYSPRLGAFRRRHPSFHMTLAGLEVALFRAHLAARGRGEHAHWGGRLAALETDITVPFTTDPNSLGHWLGRMTPLGFTAYKIKVSGDVAADMTMLRAARDLLRRARDRFIIRLDGNQGYTAATYRRMLRRLEAEKFQIELFEQPLRKDDYAGLKRIRGWGGIPVILDETVFCAADCRRVIEANLGDGVNIKVAKSGIAESAAILALARRAKLKLMIGCMTETMVGLSAGIRLAAGTGAFDYIDLDSVHFLSHRNRFEEITISNRRFSIARGGAQSAAVTETRA